MNGNRLRALLRTERRIDATGTGIRPGSLQDRSGISGRGRDGGRAEMYCNAGPADFESFASIRSRRPRVAGSREGGKGCLNDMTATTLNEEPPDTGARL